MNALRKACCSLAGVGCLASAGLATPDVDLSAHLVTNAVPSPLDVTFAPGDTSRVFIVARAGQVRIIKNGTLLPTPLVDVSGNLSTIGERGLLALAFHPDFQENGHLYLRYVQADGFTVVERYTISAEDPDRADPDSGRRVIRFENDSAFHNGGPVFFGTDGHMYISVGDDTELTKAQDRIDNFHGKILRIDVDGDDFPRDDDQNYAIPPGNPFVGRTGDDEIWALGLRNPFRVSVDRMTGELWVADVGQSHWEEINLQPTGEGGHNYGWPCMEGDHCYNGSGCTCQSVALTKPIFEYSHDAGCSITGGRVYRGCAIPSMRGRYFFADFCSSSIWSLGMEGSNVGDLRQHEIDLESDGAELDRIVAFGEDAFGELYICQLTGEIHKIVPSDAPSDDNDNGIPDICEGASGDVTHDRRVDAHDLLRVLQSLGNCPACEADLNADGVVNGVDVLIVINRWG